MTLGSAHRRRWSVDLPRALSLWLVFFLLQTNHFDKQMKTACVLCLSSCSVMAVMFWSAVHSVQPAALGKPADSPRSQIWACSAHDLTFSVDCSCEVIAVEMARAAGSGNDDPFTSRRRALRPAYNALHAATWPAAQSVSPSSLTGRAKHRTTRQSCTASITPTDLERFQSR